jgi:hypothetical protein
MPHGRKRLWVARDDFTLFGIVARKKRRMKKDRKKLRRVK